MNAIGWLQILLFAGLIALLTRPVGRYLYAVLEESEAVLPGPILAVERGVRWLCGVKRAEEQLWHEYARSIVWFSLFGALVSYAIMRLQAMLPLNPQGLAGVPPWLACNTAVSFVTNTNWQAYGGESTMSYLSQMLALAWHNFMSAAAGIAVAVAMARGLTRRAVPGSRPTIGNFWDDLIRVTVHVLLPACVILALVLVSQGVIQNLSPYRQITTVEGASQTLAMGPVASQEAIKQLGTNGGGFFNANAAHPFENPTPITNLLSLLMIFVIPAGLVYMYGLMADDTRQGWVLWWAMMILFAVGVTVCYHAETQPNPALRGLAVDQSAGNLEGKETRFGIANSALYAVVTTDASCGAVNAMHDSFNPLGGLVPLGNILLGEVIFGGVGAGLYGILMYVVLTVFLAGLMVGRTPEYLGKKIETREMKYVTLYIVVFPLLILVLSAWSLVTPHGLCSLNNQGPHGLSEILYAFTSGAGNNGSAFAGLNANTDWYNAMLALAMVGGRFFMILPALALAGSMAGKKVLPAGPGTFPTDGKSFLALLLSVIVICGALTFFPALMLGPIAEHLVAAGGKVY